MAQDRDSRNGRSDDDMPVPGTPRSSGEWAKATAKSPDDFPEEEMATAEPSESSGEAAVETERETYRREKEAEGRRMAQPARAERDPAWQSKDHLDPKRDSHRPSRSGAAKDAEGQDERDSIDQTITDKGYTETR